jgi:hypothetical protein
MLARRDLGLSAISSPTQYASPDVNAGVLPCCVDTLASSAAGNCDPYCLGSQPVAGAPVAVPLAASPFSFLSSSFAIGSFQVPVWALAGAAGLALFAGKGHR